VVGSLLKALLGYNGNPSLIEVCSYVLYFAAVYLATRLWGGRAQSRPRGRGQEMANAPSSGM